MALKLIWRNIQRSGGDYLLLALTVTLLVAILCLANCIAVFGSIQAGFQTASLPVLIVIILFLLINTIHTFMLHQRAQALAVTLLLGMERRKLRRFYLGELCVIGIGCFLLGTLLGASLFSVVISPLLQIRTNTSWLSLMRKAFFKPAVTSFWPSCCQDAD
ncbi:MAG: FtsX-like permease family protein [Holdemania massiliensis]